MFSIRQWWSSAFQTVLHPPYDNFHWTVFLWNLVMTVPNGTVWKCLLMSRYIKSLASPLSTGQLPCHKKNLDWFDMTFIFFPWQIHVSYFLSPCPQGASKLINKLFQNISGIKAKLMHLSPTTYLIFKNRYNVCPSSFLREFTSFSRVFLITNVS